MNYVAFLNKNGQALEKHIINMPEYGEKGWYISLSSVSAFKNREAQRLYDANKKGYYPDIHCSVWMIDTWQHDIDLSAKSIKEITGKDYIHPFELLPTTVHNSIFEFYKFINYNYKKKKYV